MAMAIPQRQVTPGWGAIIREAREARNLTQRLLGEAIGVDHSRISQLENENWQPNLDDIHALCTALGIWPEPLLSMLGLPITPSIASRLPRDLLEAYQEMSPEGQRLLSGVAKSLQQTHPRTAERPPRGEGRTSAR